MENIRFKYYPNIRITDYYYMGEYVGSSYVLPDGFFYKTFPLTRFIEEHNLQYPKTAHSFKPTY